MLDPQSLRLPSDNDRHELTLNYGHRHRWMKFGSDQYVWLANPNVVLTPDPVGSTWKSVLYALSGFLFVAGIIVVGLNTRNEHCSDEPGPCYFNYISHWYYIWFTAFFFVWALAPYSRIARWLAYEFHWFNFGSAWTWSILTTVLLISMTRSTVESLLPLHDDDDVGMYVLSLLILHYWPLVLLLWFNGQWGECIAAFWVRRLSWLAAYFTVVTPIVLLVLEIWSPVILWFIYLSIFNPIAVYHISPAWAQDYTLAYVVGILVIMIAGLSLGAYLDGKARSLIVRRLKGYSGSHATMATPPLSQKTNDTSQRKRVYRVLENNNNSTSSDGAAAVPVVLIKK